MGNHWQLKYEKQIGRNQKVIKNQIDEIEIKPDSKNKKRRRLLKNLKLTLLVQVVNNDLRLNLKKVIIVRIVKLINKKQKHQIVKKVLKQYRDYSMGLHFVN